MNKFKFPISLFSFILLTVLVSEVMEKRSATITPGNLQKKSAGIHADVIEVSIDTVGSLIFWRGTEMWGAGKHEGTVNFKSGRLLLESGRIVGGRLTANMNTIAITDMPEHEVIARRNLINHLKSDDFFLTEKYPAALFEITETGQLDGDSLKVWGNLTIRGVTKPIAVEARLDTASGSRMRLHTDFMIDRFKWKVAYQGSFWKKISSILDNTLVDREIQLSIRLILEENPI